MSQRSERNVEAGQLIADRYRLEAPIGHGAMGAVWRAAHVRLDSPLAIKFLNSAIANEPAMLERFLREARAAAAVRSSHVVQIFDYGVDDGSPYIAMELLVGETLDARLGARGPLAPPEVDRIFGEIARAVGVAHELGVVHRDLKPANIFLSREGEHEITKVLDFGIAKLLDNKLEAPAARGTGTGILLGTPQYMSPEQARGHRQVDRRTDLWALAVLAFECLTGRQPFESETLGDLVVQICTGAPLLPSRVAALPPAFDRWFLRGVNKEPSQRFASAAEMAAELHALLAAEGLAAASRPRSEPAPARLLMLGTEVLTDRGLDAAPTRATREPALATDASAPAVPLQPAEPAPSFTATAVAAEVLPRTGPARRRQLALAALALGVGLSVLGSIVFRKPPGPASIRIVPSDGAHASAESAGVSAPSVAPAGGSQRAEGGPEALGLSRNAADTASVPANEGRVGTPLPGRAEARGASSETLAPGVSGGAGDAPLAADGSNTPSSAAMGGTPASEASATRTTTRAPAARTGAPTRDGSAASAPASGQPPRAGAPRRTPAIHAQRGPDSASPASGVPSTSEVTRDPASVPATAADPYADRL